jgi:soluble lytic murein transglycosylase
VNASASKRIRAYTPGVLRWLMGMLGHACVLLSLVSLAQAQTTLWGGSWVTSNKGDDNAIVEMQKAFKRGDKARLAQLWPQAQGHVLEPWAAYWLLKANLAEASEAQIQDFFRRYAGTYQEDRLRNDWLQLLGQRRDWAAFAAEYPRFRMNDDKEVRCYAILVEHLNSSTPNPRGAEELRKNWLSQREADDGCTAAAARLQGTPGLQAQDVWHKARLATEANRPRAARDAVQIVAPEATAWVTELSSNPVRFLNDKHIALRKVRREIVTLALIKLALTDIDSAAAKLSTVWAAQLSAEERNWVWGVIGTQMARRMGSASGSDALKYFSKVSQDSDLNDDMLAWKARAALRAGTKPLWPVVLAAIREMGEEAQKEPVWIYWKARALLATVAAQDTGQRTQAQALLQSIASVRGFYEQLALEALGQKITVPTKPAALTPEEKEAARINPGLNRGIYAISLGLRSEGVREWNYTSNLHQAGGMSDRELLAVAQLACERQVWDRCINTSERSKIFIDFEQRFPMPFRQTVIERSQAIGLDPAYVYGLIRQESRFVMDARSSVGASGLMQVMPATARWTAKKIGMLGFGIEQLNDQNTNITIGTAYLKLALDDLDGSMPLAAAAYNAGPGRPRLWRNGPVLEAAIWAENIPFNETRDYVKKVLSNTTNYAALLTGQPQSLKARLGSIGPRDSAQPETQADLP